MMIPPKDEHYIEDEPRGVDDLVADHMELYLTDPGRFDNIIGDALTDQQHVKSVMWLGGQRTNVGLTPAAYAETFLGELMTMLRTAHRMQDVIDVTQDAYNSREAAIALAETKTLIGELVINRCLPYIEDYIRGNVECGDDADL